MTTGADIPAMKRGAKRFLPASCGNLRHWLLVPIKFRMSSCRWNLDGHDLVASLRLSQPVPGVGFDQVPHRFQAMELGIPVSAGSGLRSLILGCPII
jgi:hypothetical protein